MQPGSGFFGRLSDKGVLADNFTGQPEPSQQKQLVSKQTFTYHYIIGKGGFGKVWKVESKKNRQNYAMKEMLKSL
jgi:serine/threonine protein kinase